MDIRKLIVSCLLISFAGIVFAAETPAVQKRPRPSLAERRARREARIAAEGGIVARPPQGKVVRILVKTDKYSIQDAVAVAKKISDVIHVFVEVVASENQSKNETGCLLTLADLGQAPTLLVAPEDYWATINVARLAEDKPTPEVFKARVEKELWRSVGFALGAAYPAQYTCVMRPVSKPADLDNSPVSVLTPQPMMGVVQTATKLGFATGGQATYRIACEEGWAAAPTNDVQKAIWEKVHSVPKNPMKIEFDPKKGK